MIGTWITRMTRVFRSASQKKVIVDEARLQLAEGARRHGVDPGLDQRQWRTSRRWLRPEDTA